MGRSVGGGPFDAEVRALRGTRTPTCHGRLATQFGSAGADTIVGTPRGDVLVGRGGPGNDLLSGGADQDRLFGGPGTDVLKP